MAKEKYTKYKNSTVSWLGDIPEHWEIRRIKYVFQEHDSRSETGKEDLLSVSQYTGVTKKSDKVAEGESISNAKTLEGYKIVEKGNLVINIMLAWNGSLGISKYNGIVSPAYCVYRNFIGDERYFGYLFKTKNAKQEFKKQSTGIIDSRLRMYTDSFFNIKTALPPKQEQTTIANFLDYKTEKINRFIKKKKQLIELLNEQKAANINQSVTKGINPNVTMKDSGIEWLGEIPVHWEIRKLKSQLEIFGRIGYRGYKTTDLVDKGEGAITISPSNMKDFYMQFDECSYLSWEKYEESPEIKIYNMDILFVKTGSTYGKASLVEGLIEKATINPQIVVFKNIQLNETYLWYQLKTQSIKTQVELSVVGGTIPTISQSKIGAYSIVVPPKSEQKLIVDYIESEISVIDKTISTIEKEITLVEEYKTALIAEAVTGKIDVRDFKIPTLETPLAMVAEEAVNYNKR